MVKSSVSKKYLKFGHYRIFPSLKSKSKRFQKLISAMNSVITSLVEEKKNLCKLLKFFNNRSVYIPE